MPEPFFPAAAASGFTDDVTADNVEAFTTTVTAELAEKKGVEEQPLAMVIGENAFTRYVILRKKGDRLVRQEILDTVFDGEVRIAGQPPGTGPRLGYMFQSPRLMPWLTVETSEAVSGSPSTSPSFSSTLGAAPLRFWS